MNKRCFPGILIVLITILILNSCSGAPAGGPSVWIDVPLDGLTFPDVQEINIEGHAASSSGVSKVEVWINGALFTTIDNPPAEGTLGKFQAAWRPPATGEYTIQAIAFGANGIASQPDTARVSFGGNIIPVITVSPIITLTPEVTLSPTATETFTPTPPPVELIRFWAEPSTIEAGSCTLIQWHVENVQKVIFGGIEQQVDGSYRDCLCSNERYTLTLLKQDGTEERTSVDITVTGSCITPTVVDSTPPPTPSPAVPADGLTIACKASQTLTWLPVDDPSGIAKYGVQVQRHAGDNNWQPAPSGDQAVTGKSTSIPVECGWYYRWRVIAVDGAGNESGWSGWSQFIISLG